MGTDWPVVLELHPDGWQQAGRGSGAVKRFRGFSSMEALVHTLPLHVRCGWLLLCFLKVASKRAHCLAINPFVF
jgi:hypothetical protein